MTEEDRAQALQAIFVEHFNIPPEHFDWEKPLEYLQQDFKILSYLVFLEQLLQQKFEAQLPIVEHVSTAFHTPKDILLLINSEL